jgi:hypothetical protein
LLFLKQQKMIEYKKKIYLAIPMGGVFLTTLKISIMSNFIIDHVGILWLNAKTRTNGTNGAIQGAGWQLITRTPADTANDLDLFMATKKLWQAQNKDIQPRKLSYQILYKK